MTTPFPRLTLARAAMALIAAMALGLSALAAGGVQARVFGAPVALSANGHAGNASVGIDDAGDATAVWADGALLCSDHPYGGAWTTPGTFSPGLYRHLDPTITYSTVYAVTN